MNVLMLAISAGGGHIKAAETLKEYILLKEPNSNVKIIDTLKYLNPILDKLVIGGYIKAIKSSPSLYGKLYNYNYASMDNTLASVSNKINEIMAYRLLPLIEEFSPDIIVSTHPFPSEMLSILKEQYKLNAPVICIITDYACHSFWLYPFIDAYIIPNKEMIWDMISKGISSNSIFDYGIPVSPAFFEKYNRTELLEELNLSKEKNTVLIMGGSLGMGKITSICLQLCSIDVPLQIIIISGNNKKLFKELTKLKAEHPQISKVLGYTDNVSTYMKCSDLLITKPGGMTITEALACSTPMALFSAIPGQEERNANFLVKNNLAVNIEDFDSYKEAFEYILISKDKLKTMKANCSNFSCPHCGSNIYNLMKKIIANATIL
ncbi:MGDG synthase family glycosyltransferase [Haloimpatiens sp. FM7315]|uniref:MGDG synthase family glycosyltransferase n=1 Tax=Haloimpatiens sp. FM7315 TaxID=3298609 RepID=UPI0035A353CF